MIIFTPAALAVVLILAVLIGPLYFFDFMHGPAEHWVIGLGALVVGAFASLAGHKARFFWIFPVWFIGLGILVYQSFETWGGWGLLVLLGVGAGLVGLLMFAGWRIEKAEWRRAPAALEQAKVALLEEDDDKLWEELGRALFIPAVTSGSSEMFVHDREVLALIREHMGDRLWPEARDAVDALDVLLQEASSGSKVQLDAAIFAAVKKLIDSKGATVDPAAPTVVE